MLFRSLAVKMQTPSPTIIDTTASPAGTVPSGAAPQAPPPNAGATAVPDVELLTFVQHVVTPSLVEYFEDEEKKGTDYAEALDNMFSAPSFGPARNMTRVQQLQAIGPVQIFTLYKNHAPRDVWERLTKRGEPAFQQFVNEFCSWKAADAEGEPEAPGIVDYDSDEPAKSAPDGGADSKTGAF